MNLSQLNRNNAYIFRITHIDNVPWILGNGLHCRNSPEIDPDFVQIGSIDLIGKRAVRVVSNPPGGTLSDYVPFYFTPRSPMLYNIKTGYNGVQKRSMNDIVILVASLKKLHQSTQFLFTDRHAYLRTAVYSSSLTDLDMLSWSLWQTSDFQGNSEHPDKIDFYQAEALIYRHMPIHQVLGMACFSDGKANELIALVSQFDLDLKIRTIPEWFF